MQSWPNPDNTAANSDLKHQHTIAVYFCLQGQENNNIQAQALATSTCMTIRMIQEKIL